MLQGSNLEMVDRGVLDRVPDILLTLNLKRDTSRAYSSSKMGFRYLFIFVDIYINSNVMFMMLCLKIYMVPWSGLIYCHLRNSIHN